MDDVRIVHQPSVYLLGTTAVRDEELAKFLADHEVSDWQTDTEVGAEKLVEVAGRVCYMSFAKPRPGGNAAYVNHILDVGHGSVIEHATFSLLFAGVSRSLTHELVRHRAGLGFSQLSQRYVDESAAEYVEPEAIKTDPEAHALWLTAMRQSHQAYLRLTEVLARKFSESCPACARQSPSCPACGGTGYACGLKDATDRRKAARSAARSVLPNATETKIVVTGNARAWRHILEMRGSRHAEAEIRQLAFAVHAVLVKASPNLFGDFETREYAPNRFELVTSHHKV